MATGTSLIDFFAWAGRKDGPFFDHELWSYLLHHGYQSVPGAHLGGQQVTPTAVLTVQFTLESQPAYLNVATKDDPNVLTHAVYWDGQKVHDPCPTVHGPALSDYRILDVHPIIRFRPPA